jgi:hypothetical protein
VESGDRPALRGATVGLLGGVFSGLVGEALVYLISRLFPTDVGIVGLAFIWAVPLGALTGLILGWRRRLPTGIRGVLVTGIPALGPGLIVAWIQWTLR